MWKQNPSTGKWELVADAWHIGFVDAIGGRGLFGQVEGRNSASVADWLTSQPASWREQVRYVAIDLCSTFRAAVHRALPHAAVVVDCFHVVQLAQRHLADLRRRLAWKQHGRRARKGDSIYTVRKLLRRNKEDLTEDQRTIRKVELDHLGTYGRQIHAAWKAKELLRDLLGLAVSRTYVTPDRSTISVARHRFFAHVADHAYLPELVTLAETVEQWWDGIETYLITGSPTLPPKATTASSSSKRVTPSASGTERTNVCAHAVQPLGGADGRRTPTKFEDPNWFRVIPAPPCSVGGMLRRVQISRSSSKLAPRPGPWSRRYPSGTSSRARASRRSRIHDVHVVSSASNKSYRGAL
ncbi:transposase [Streptomyces pacificus]|uniref:transposase n=1 Tax=Streptomyces pacificus TaxID=2705029 RepID=UPI00156349F8|nr:transposase [Streptomyces pacificus]